jgi:hypothetical protein
MHTGFLAGSTSESKDWQFLPRPVVECIQGHRVRVAEESGFGSAKVWPGGLKRSCISAFPLKEDKRRGSRLAPAKRRVAGIGGVIPRPEGSLPRDPVPVVPLLWAPGRLCPTLNAYTTADTSQQRNTHSIESREVHYTWHPWCGRIAAVHKTFAKNGQVVSHCSIEENSEARHLEIVPTENSVCPSTATAGPMSRNVTCRERNT